MEISRLKESWQEESDLEQVSRKACVAYRMDLGLERAGRLIRGRRGRGEKDEISRKRRLTTGEYIAKITKLKHTTGRHREQDTSSRVNYALIRFALIFTPNAISNGLSLSSPPGEEAVYSRKNERKDDVLDPCSSRIFLENFK